MICGFPPFYNRDREILYKQIKQANVTYPNDISNESIDLLSKIFVTNPKKRLGSKGAEEVKNHPFFQGIDWVSILNKKIKPPFQPRLNSPTDTRYIHQEFVTEDINDNSLKHGSLNSNDEKQFTESFDYNKKLS